MKSCPTATIPMQKQVTLASAAAEPALGGLVLRSADQESRPKSRLAARTGGGTSRYNKDNAPIWPRSAAVEKFFQLSVLGLVASGFLAGSGYPDTPIQGSPTAWSRS